MTDVVARAKTALEGVSEGPWHRHDFGFAGEQEPSSIVIHAGKFDWRAIQEGDFIASTAAWDGPEDCNAAFIAEARSLVPELVDRIEHLEAVLFQINEARVDYDEALFRREHGGVAASRFVHVVAAVLDAAVADQGAEKP